MQPHSIDRDYSAFLVVESALNAKFMAAISNKRKLLLRWAASLGTEGMQWIKCKMCCVRKVTQCIVNDSETQTRRLPCDIPGILDVEGL